MYYSTRDKIILQETKDNFNIQSLDIKNLKSNKPRLLSIRDPKIRFEKFKKEQEIKIENDEKKQKVLLKIEHDKYASEIRNVEGNLHNKKKDTDLKELEQWRENMEIKKDFEIRLHNEKYCQANYFKNLVFDSIKNSEIEKTNQIGNFEKNLSRLGLDMINVDQKLKKNNKAALSGEMILQKIREKIHANVVAKNERDRRKRKIQIEQKKAQEELIKNERKLNNENQISTESIQSEVLLTKQLDEKTNEYNDWKNLRNINNENEELMRKVTEDVEREKNKNYDEIFHEYFSQKEKKKYFNKEEFIKSIWNEDRILKQRELNIKQEKRIKNVINIKKITEQILDVVDVVFDFQIECNSDLLDGNYWKDLMKNFVNEASLKNNNASVCKSSKNYFVSDKSKKSENNDSIKHKLNDSIDLENSHNFYMDNFYEECEFFDYINFIGQYKSTNIIPKNIVNKMLDICDIMGNDPPPAIANISKYGKITDAYKEYEPTDEDIENLTIPSENVKNYNLSDIINILIDIKFSNSQNNDNVIFNNGIATNMNLLGTNNNNNNGNMNNNLIVNNNINNNSESGIFNLNNNNYNLNNPNNIKNVNRENNHSSISNIENQIYQLNNNIPHNLNSTFHTNINQVKTNIFNVFNSIPLKILFLGKKYSGRKTQIKYLTESFPLKFYNVEELIEKNLSLLEDLEIPIEDHPKLKNLKKNELDKAIADRQIDEQKFELIKPHILFFKDYKEKKIKYPNDIIFDFLLELIKIDFPEKSQSQIIEELINKNKRKREFQEELLKIKDEKAKGLILKSPNGKNETFYLNEIQKLNIDSNKGFIVIDFPGGLQQAKYFENKISGYINEIEKPKNFTQQIKDNFHSILDRVPKANTQKDLSQGAFDLIFYLEVKNDEIIRRVKNKKIDNNTGMIYHMEDYPPPSDDKKLLEKLIPYEENINFNNLNVINNIFDKETDALIEFYESFGHQKYKLKSLNKFNCMLPACSNDNNKHLFNDKIEKNPNLSLKENIKKDFKEQVIGVNSEIKEIIYHMIKISEEKENEILAHATQASKELINNNQIIQGNYTRDNMTHTGTSNNILNNNTMVSRKNSNSNLSNFNNRESQKTIKESQIINNQQTIQTLGTNSDPLILENANVKTKNLFSSNKTLVINSSIQNPDEEDFNKYHKKLEEARRKLSNYSVENIYSSWTKMYENYILNVKGFFKILRKQKESIILTFNRMQEKFIDFLRRPSKKMVDINKFQKKYNRFFDEYPELRGDEHVKEEFHKDVYDLSDRIWRVIEERKIEVIQERKKIMESGYVHKEVERFYSNFEKLIMLEVEKFFTNVNTIKDFYNIMDLKNLPQDLLNFNPYEIVKDDEIYNLPICKDSFGESKIKNDNLKTNRRSINDNNRINKNDTNQKMDENNYSKYPRIEKLFKNCIKLILKYDEFLKNIEKIAKSNAMNNISNESSIKKIPKLHCRRMQESTFVDDKRDIFIYEEELKNSLKLEKNKFKYRITFLNYWAYDYLEKLRKISNLVYHKLDDWIISTIKAENDAMNNLVTIFDGCVEKEMRLRIDFEMDSFEIYKMVDFNDHIEIQVLYYLSL